ncbi:MAG: 23S rRNA (uridine(2552)-2'-O)-methyltransferase [Candidatus Lokiarchaeota archaeon]|nr:23S rRNA (uridine(2552)-2'-O)-methyltransferase [Candidatus Lokiarchaeota archaeon]
MTKWMKKRKKEEYYRKAKKQGYRSRATYKLIQLNRKYNLLSGARSIIDICCAPGGWIQAIQSILGNDVYILGIDKSNLKPIEGNVDLLQGDITEEEIINSISNYISDKVDVIVSDCSMKTIGASNLDVERQNYLVTSAFKNIVQPFLKTGGHFIAKVFQGRNTNNIKNDLKHCFRFIKFTKPKASLKNSRELYLICKLYKIK